VLPPDEPGAAKASLPVVRRSDGTLGLRMRGNACAVLGDDRACTQYAGRPFACRSFPVQLHALDRLQADLHLGCPGIPLGHDGLARVGTLPEAEPGEAMALRVAEEALACGVLEIAAAEANWREMQARLQRLGCDHRRDDVAGAFQDLPWGNETLAGLYVAAGKVDLRPNEVPDVLIAVEADHVAGLPALLHAVGREVPKRKPDHVHPETLSWRDLDVARARPRDALALSSEMNRELGEHMERILRRDLTWGHALWLVDQADYQPSPAAAYAQVLGDCFAALVLRASLVRSAEQAIRSFEWWYWGLPTIGSAL
jgi:hypothetical protein